MKIGSGIEKLFVLIAGTTACFVPNSNGGEPPERRGVYAIWAQNKPALLDLPFVRGGQVVAQWGELEPSEGQYDFSELDKGLKQMADRGFCATVQVNGNLKPAWLFDVVPHHSEKLSHQIRDKQGTLMYWHPRHQGAYFRFIHAYAEYLKKSPYRSSVLGVRLNFNGLGTEHLPVPEDKRSLDQWIVPKGGDPGPEWKGEIASAYKAAVVEAFAKDFCPEMFVFVRNNIEPEIRSKYENLFQTGKLGWFHTSSEMEPRGQGGERQYRTFVDYCRSGKTLGYAESWADSWGRHGGKTDPRWCSPPQWNYWRLLCDLNCGVSFIAVYGADLSVVIEGKAADKAAGKFRDEFVKAFEFASKYAGYHASPERSPGAWVAFREGHSLKGDYSFLMRRLPDNTKEAKNVGPDDQRYGAWARVLPKGGSMKLALNDAFAASVNGQSVTVNVVYLDREEDGFRVDAAGGRFVKKNGNTGKWQTAAFQVEKAAFAKDAAGAHVTVVSNGENVTLHMVEVVRSNKTQDERE